MKNTTFAPIALVLAVGHTLNRLNTDSEIVVMNASGMSPWRIFRPFLTTTLVVSLLVRRHRLWIRISPTAGAGTVNVEVGGLARTDNSGWGSEFERLTERLLEGFAPRPPEVPSRPMQPAGVAARPGEDAE